jgi:Photosynthesis system II assembly factor YCF48
LHVTVLARNPIEFSLKSILSLGQLRMTIDRYRLPLGMLALAVSCATVNTRAADEELVDQRAPLVTDFLDGAYLPSAEGIVVAGTHGLLGLLKVSDAGAELTHYPNIPNEDFTSLEKLSDSEVLLGTAAGKLFVFDGTKVTEVAKISEYNEPVLDIAVANGAAWAVGGRGMIASSKDGKTWTNVTITDAVQPQITIPGTDPGEWYFGAGNLQLDSIVFTGNVAGKPAVVDTDYALYPDEGFVQFIKKFDAAPAPTISFKFGPGPAFRPGDVSWNVVLFDGTNLTLAGEFGMILQSSDSGQSWTRRDTLVTPKEPEPPYWIAGTQKGTNIYLTGAAGIIHTSADNGVTWSAMPSPGNEGVFGVTVTGSGQPAIAGAVGLIGLFNNGEWALADRSELQLLSWLKTPVEMPDGTLLMLGGRSTLIALKDGKWVRVPVTNK